jgi:hypothetical protein
MLRAVYGSFFSRIAFRDFELAESRTIRLSQILKPGRITLIECSPTLAESLEGVLPAKAPSSSISAPEGSDVTSIRIFVSSLLACGVPKGLASDPCRARLL